MVIKNYIAVVHTFEKYHSRQYAYVYTKGVRKEAIVKSLKIA